MTALRLPRHEQFARRRVAALDESASASYRLCGYKATRSAAYACASRLLRSAKVAERIAELQQQAALRHEAKIDTIGRQFDEAHRLALEHKQCAAAVAASMGLAKLYGLIVNRNETRAVSEFDGCTSTADLVDVIVKEAGSAEAALRSLDAMREELVKRISKPPYAGSISSQCSAT